MRQILMGDIIAAARALQNVPQQKQVAAATEMFYRAHAADKVVKRTGAPHATWGNGSLLASASGWATNAEPFLSNLDYLGSLRLVIDALIVWKKAQAALNSSCAAMDLCLDLPLYSRSDI